MRVSILKNMGVYVVTYFTVKGFLTLILGYRCMKQKKMINNSVDNNN